MDSPRTVRLYGGWRHGEARHDVYTRYISVPVDSSTGFVEQIYEVYGDIAIAIAVREACSYGR